MRLTDARLVEMALAALEEIAATLHHRPVRRSAALRLVLAYLASRQPCERAFYDLFWRAVGHKRPQDRWGQANAALNGIYHIAGIRREIEVVSAYEDRARKALLRDADKRVHPDP